MNSILNDITFLSVFWWTIAVVNGSIAYRFLSAWLGHNLKSEFATMAVIISSITIGVTLSV